MVPHSCHIIHTALYPHDSIPLTVLAGFLRSTDLHHLVCSNPADTQSRQPPISSSGGQSASPCSAQSSASPSLCTSCPQAPSPVLLFSHTSFRAHQPGSSPALPRPQTPHLLIYSPPQLQASSSAHRWSQFNRSRQTDLASLTQYQHQHQHHCTIHFSLSPLSLVFSSKKILPILPNRTAPSQCNAARRAAPLRLHVGLPALSVTAPYPMYHTASRFFPKTSSAGRPKKATIIMALHSSLLLMALVWDGLSGEPPTAGPAGLPSPSDSPTAHSSRVRRDL